MRETHEPKQVPTDAAEELEKETTVEPTESDHPKCEDLVVANGRWSLTRIEPQEVSLRRKLDTSTLRKIIYCRQFPSYDMCSSMLLLLFLPQEISNSPGGRLQEVKNNAKSLNSQPQLVVAGSYRRDTNCKTYWVGFGALDRWSHMEVQLYSNRVNHLSRRCD